MAEPATQILFVPHTLQSLSTTPYFSLTDIINPPHWWLVSWKQPMNSLLLIPKKLFIKTISPIPFLINKELTSLPIFLIDSVSALLHDQWVLALNKPLSKAWLISISILEFSSGICSEWILISTLSFDSITAWILFLNKNL